VTDPLRRLHPALNQLAAAARGAVGVRADWPTTAISLHIYSTDVSRVGSSVRRYYG
jgi:hypothetical protein